MTIILREFPSLKLSHSSSNGWYTIVLRESCLFFTNFTCDTHSFPFRLKKSKKNLENPTAFLRITLIWVSLKLSDSFICSSRFHRINILLFCSHSCHFAFLTLSTSWTSVQGKKWHLTRLFLVHFLKRKEILLNMFCFWSMDIYFQFLLLSQMSEEFPIIDHVKFWIDKSLRITIIQFQRGNRISFAAAPFLMIE